MYYNKWIEKYSTLEYYQWCGYRADWFRMKENWIQYPSKSIVMKKTGNAVIVSDNVHQIQLGTLYRWPHLHTFKCHVWTSFQLGFSLINLPFLPPFLAFSGYQIIFSFLNVTVYQAYYSTIFLLLYKGAKHLKRSQE